MNKRVLSLLAALLLLTLVVIPATGLGLIRPAYVQTSNGKGLNLRPSPSTNGDPIASIPYGALVNFDGTYSDDTWIAVNYNGMHGYVMRRYLTYDQPPPIPVPAPTARPTAKPTAKPEPAQDSVREIFKGFSFTNYAVVVRPGTPGGLVHMRWAPTKASDILRDYHQNDQLTVIAQNSTWAQVVDPRTGVTGFMMRSFLTEIGFGVVVTDVDTSGS